MEGGGAGLGSGWAQTLEGTRADGGKGVELGGSQGGEGAGQTLDSLPPAGSPGYPSEAAAEVVLATLREWLEQHKDKVSPGPGPGDQTGVRGVHPGSANQPSMQPLPLPRTSLLS